MNALFLTNGILNNEHRFQSYVTTMSYVERYNMQEATRTNIPIHIGW